MIQRRGLKKVGQKGAAGRGTRWAESSNSLLAEVPAVIAPEEGNILINPRYRGATRLKASKVRRWTYDFRLT